MFNIRTFSRIFVGLVFIFSGFVKGVDPLGTAYRIEDYFIAYGTNWAIPLSLFLSIALSTMEFVLGLALLFNLRLRALSWLLFPLMIFFTGLTLYDAIYTPVSDCGCFGDAIKLTNWQTFYKNIVLIIFVYIIFKQRRKFKNVIKLRMQTVFVLIFIIAFSSFSFYQYNHLPLIDYRQWKIGNDMSEDEESDEKVFLIYKNKATGEKKEYLSPNYPWNDSVWMSEWTFVDQRIDVIEKAQSIDLIINTYDGDNITSEIIENPDYQFLFISGDINRVSLTAFEKIKTINHFCDDKGLALIGLSSSSVDEVDALIELYSIEFAFYNADDIALKTMIRANPGLILLKQGKVLNKWHYHDFPDIAELEKELKLN